jgi:hypothetical protein
MIDHVNFVGSIGGTSANVTVKNCTVTCPDGLKGINLLGTGGITTITNNYVHHVATNSPADDIGGIDGIVCAGHGYVTDNVVSNIGGVGLTIVTGIHLRDTTDMIYVSGNKVSNVYAVPSAGGIARGIWSAILVTVTGNNIIGIGFLVDSSETAVGIYLSSNGSSCTNNSVNQIGYSASTVTATGIYTTGDAPVSNNVIASLNSTTTCYGIELNTGGAVVSGNILSGFTSSSAYAVYLNGGASGYIGTTIFGNSYYSNPVLTSFILDNVATPAPLMNVFGNSGLNLSPMDETRTFQMKNISGGAVAAGDLVTIALTAAGNEVTTSTTIGDNTIFGMLTVGGADAAIVTVQTEGKTVLLKVDGTVAISIGDFITQSTTAGVGMKASTGNTVIAIALEAYSTADASGVIDAILISPRLI